MYPSSIRDLVNCLKNLPGIGDKSAERLAFSMVNFDKDLLTNFSNSIISLRDNITRCSVCNNLTEGSRCLICSDNSRDMKTVFVVEKPKDVFLFEKLGIYNGLYHVLDGVISPLEGKGPDDINITSLIERIKNDSIKEVILALKPNIEGETTMQYIIKVLENYDVNVSKLATGVPMGTDIEYIDSLTLEMALEERKIIS